MVKGAPHEDPILKEVEERGKEYVEKSRMGEKISELAGQLQQSEVSKTTSVLFEAADSARKGGASEYAEAYEEVALALSGKLSADKLKEIAPACVFESIKVLASVHGHMITLLKSLLPDDWRDRSENEDFVPPKN